MESIWNFKVPPGVGGGDFQLRELSVDVSERIQDQIMLAGGAKADNAKLMQAAKASEKEHYFAAIVSWKGQPIEQAEVWWMNLRPKERLCVQRAYRQIHTLTEDEETYLTESIAAEKSGK